MPVAEGLAWLQRLLDAEPENRTLDANLAGFVTVLEAMSGRIDEAREHIADSRALARDLGLTWQAAVQELLSGYVELMGGNPVAAERDMLMAQQAFREIGEGWFLSTSMVDLPRALYEQGRYDDAFALLGSIDELSGPDCEWRIKRTGSPRGCSPDAGAEEAERLAREGVAIAANSEFVVLHVEMSFSISRRFSASPAESREAAGAAEDARWLPSTKGRSPLRREREGAGRGVPRGGSARRRTALMSWAQGAAGRLGGRRRSARRRARPPRPAATGSALDSRFAR